MPIEIKELYIKAVVQNEGITPLSNGDMPPEDNTSQVNAIVAECVEQVLNILKEKQER